MACHIPERKIGIMICLLWVLAVLVCHSCSVASQSSTSADYEIPDVCQGMNPLRYLGIKTANDTAYSQADAEHALGLTLNDFDLDIVQIYTTLEFDNATFAPGRCPGKGLTAESAAMSEAAAPLAVVFSRQTAFADTFLSFKTNVRLYSLGLLARRVAWRAAENQTLRLAVSADDVGVQCWNASNSHQRKSFLHWFVNQTVNDIARRTNRSLTGLDGQLLLRLESEEESSLAATSGKGFVYESCRRSMLPGNVSLEDVSLLNYTFCSHWTHQDGPSSGNFERGIQSFLIAFVRIFQIFLWFYLLYHELVVVTRKDFGIFRQGQDFFVLPTSEPCANMQDSDFTSLLTMFHYRVHPTDSVEKIPFFLVPVLTLDCLGRPAFRRALVWAAVWFLTFWFISFQEQRLSQAFDFEISSPQAEHCEQAQFRSVLHSSEITCVVTWVTFIALFFQGLYVHIMRSRNSKSIDSNDVHIMRSRERESKGPDGCLIFIIMVFYMSWFFFVLPIMIFRFGSSIVHHVILTVLFTFIGVLVYYPVQFLLAVAIFKVVLIDILKLGKLNDVFLPDAVRCAAACRVAVRQLKGEILSECTSSLNDADFRPDSNSKNALFEQAIGSTFPGTSDDPDRSTNNRAAQSFTEKVDCCLTRAFLLLYWKNGKEVLFGEKRKKSAEEGRDALRSRTVKSARLYQKIWFSMFERCCYAFDIYLVQAVMSGFLVITFVISVDSIFAEVAKLSSTLSSWSGFILPAFVLVQSIFQFLLERSRANKVMEALVVQAKAILLQLATQKSADGRDEEWLRKNGAVRIHNFPEPPVEHPANSGQSPQREESCNGSDEAPPSEIVELTDLSPGGNSGHSQTSAPSQHSHGFSNPSFLRTGQDPPVLGFEYAKHNLKST